MRPDQQVGLGVGIVSAVGLDCLEAMSAQGLLDGVEQLHGVGGTDEALECLVRQDLRTWQLWLSVRRLGVLTTHVGDGATRPLRSVT
jgi:hypothetical protein